jgi:hypothetical protein
MYPFIIVLFRASVIQLSVNVEYPRFSSPSLPYYFRLLFISVYLLMSSIHQTPRLRYFQYPRRRQRLRKREDHAIAPLCGNDVNGHWQILFL